MAGAVQPRRRVRRAVVGFSRGWRPTHARVGPAPTRGRSVGGPREVRQTMALLGWPLLVLLAVSAVAYPLLTLALWPRVRGRDRSAPRPGWRWWPGVRSPRCCSSPWPSTTTATSTARGPELPGLAGPATRLGHAAGSARAAVEARPRWRPRRGRSAAAPSGRVRVLPDPGWSATQQWATRGRVESVTIRGIRSGLTSHAFVYLPPQYFQKEFAHRALPATQVLAGFPGGTWGCSGAWTTRRPAAHRDRARRARPGAGDDEPVRGASRVTPSAPTSPPDHRP